MLVIDALAQRRLSTAYELSPSSTSILSSISSFLPLVDRRLTEVSSPLSTFLGVITSTGAGVTGVTGSEAAPMSAYPGPEWRSFGAGLKKLQSVERQNQGRASGQPKVSGCARTQAKHLRRQYHSARRPINQMISLADPETQRYTAARTHSYSPIRACPLPTRYAGNTGRRPVRTCFAARWLSFDRSGTISWISTRAHLVGNERHGRLAWIFAHQLVGQMI